MSRTSGWSGSYRPNVRPWVTVAPDAYVSIQGETVAIGCGECRREVNFNDYITSISTEASVDSAPGSATIQMTIPDNDVNQFYAENNFIIIPMMEVEVWAKGYYTVGGVPQYYRIFWGLVSAVQTAWSNGVTSISISCKDILRWWELTNIVLNPAFLSPFGTSAHGWQLFGNQLAGMNPYAVIIKLAKESMGDFSFNTGSFLSYNPEAGAEKSFVSGYLGDVMLYWQAKFANIWNSLVLYGASGQIYTTRSLGRSLSPLEFSKKIFENEYKFSADQDPRSNAIRVDAANTAAFKIDFPRAGDVDFFQTDAQDKLSVARQARDQVGYEFYCDTSGDIVFKPPFYNLNVIPNKPVSWIQNFELIDDSMSDSEAEVITHLTSSGHAFGGTMDWGLNDEITTPNTGVFDYHLLKRYGWRKSEFQAQWAGNAKKLFFHLMDMIDKINAKRTSGSFTIPLRPELRLGFPIYVEKYDSFFYINGISHSYSVGSSATTTVSVIAKRSKFIAPKNIGYLRPAPNGNTAIEVKNQTGTTKDGKPILETKTILVPTFNAGFFDNAGENTGLAAQTTPADPVILRHPKTGRILGYPNVVMIFKKTLSNQDLERVGNQDPNQTRQARKKTKDSVPNRKLDAAQRDIQERIINSLENGKREQLIAKIRQHRYEAAATNAGVYDYAHDEASYIKEFTVVPSESVIYDQAPADVQPVKLDPTEQKKLDEANAEALKRRDELSNQRNIAEAGLRKAKADLATQTALKGRKDPKYSASLESKYQSQVEQFSKQVKSLNSKIDSINKGLGTRKVLGQLSVMVRPVSDEFGFEVIGHYRYGRGVTIDLNRLNPEGMKDVNQLRIAFAPTGGFLTDASTPAPLELQNNSALTLERMTPEDWQTGAAFNGIQSDDNANGIKTATLTSNSTYDGINAGNRSKVFIEPDSLTSARTLNELKPTISNDLLTEAVENCACGLGRPNWLTVLPEATINALIRSQPAASVAAQPRQQFVDSLNTTPIAAVLNESRTITDQNESRFLEGDQIFTGNVSNSAFFNTLNSYLFDRFKQQYPKNQEREERYTKGATPVQINDTAAASINNPSTPQSVGFSLPPDIATIYTAAANGDAEALKILQGKANFDFGLSQAAFQEIAVPNTEQRAAVAAEIANKTKTPGFSDVINPARVEAARANRAPNPFDPSRTRQ